MKCQHVISKTVHTLLRKSFGRKFLDLRTILLNMCELNILTVHIIAGMHSTSQLNSHKSWMHRCYISTLVMWPYQWCVLRKKSCPVQCSCIFNMVNKKIKYKGKLQDKDSNTSCCPCLQAKIDSCLHPLFCTALLHKERILLSHLTFLNHAYDTFFFTVNQSVYWNNCV